MKLKLLTLCSVLALQSASLYAQGHKERAMGAPAHTRCGTMEHMEYLKSVDPTLDARLKADDIEFQKRLAEYVKSAKRDANGTVTIPVVVHVLWRTNTEKISTAQVQSQIDVLNEDFGRYNADTTNTPAPWKPISANTGIQFCLAQRDPQGNSTTGIVYKQTTVTSWSDNDAIKKNAQGGDDPWDVTKYFNMWVGNLGGGLLGYAEFPTSSVSQTYGVVIGYNYFGRVGTLSAPYNKGRTATHEVGHCLNLFHIWGDDGGSCSGSDAVADTPNMAGENYGCPTYPKTDACATASPGAMFMNYMDYTDDACMNMFTNGQSTRMNNAINNYKASLKTSDGCQPVASSANDAGALAIVAPVGSTCNTSITPSVTIKNFGTAALTSVTINYRVDAGTVLTYSWTGNLASGASATVTLPAMTVTAGAHTFTAYTTSPNGQTDGNAGNDSQTSNFTVVAGTTVNYPLTEGFQGTTFPPTGWTLSNPDANNTWTRVTTAGGFGASTASARMDNFSGTADLTGQVDDLLTPMIDFSNAVTPATLTFDVAYARYDATYKDSLLGHVSTNCGSTWIRVYGKGSTGLATAPDNTNAFLPSATQWRTETVSLANYVGQPKVQFRFRSKSGYGNHLYIDNVNITAGTVGISNLPKESVIGLYPNPTEGKINLAVSLKDASTVEVRIFDSLGKLVTFKSEAGVNKTTIELDLSNQPSGLYFAQVKTNDGISIHKFTVNR